MKRTLLLAFASVCLWPVSSRAESDSPFFFHDPYADPLAIRDDYGLLHQSPLLYRTDFNRRYSVRFPYYLDSGATLLSDPGYVGALQTALRRRGYYLGPIDGVYSYGVQDAIARMQKNCSLRVTGRLSLGVRRTLHLP
jgi:Putative peptidoglycan binding domain